ncbi:MAG TPA: hypothetical protein VH560_10635, partial [Polyangia bacterium]|nr:hypothetical protein [Polyangia bacterium]
MTSNEKHAAAGCRSRRVETAWSIIWLVGLASAGLYACGTSGLGTAASDGGGGATGTAGAVAAAGAAGAATAGAAGTTVDGGTDATSTVASCTVAAG